MRLSRDRATAGVIVLHDSRASSSSSRVRPPVSPLSSSKSVRSRRTSSQSRFAPMLNGEPADEAETPMARLAEALDFQRRIEQPITSGNAHGHVRRCAAFRSSRSEARDLRRRAASRRVAACRRPLGGTAAVIARQVPHGAVLPVRDLSRASVQPAPFEPPTIALAMPSKKFSADPT
jgi:hypothetical protein